MFATPTTKAVISTSGAAPDSFLTRNAVTTVGCAVVATVPVLGTVGMVLGAPGTTALIAGIGGSAIYVGHRQHKGEPLIPTFSKDKSDADVTPAPAATAEPVPAA